MTIIDELHREALYNASLLRIRLVSDIILTRQEDIIVVCFDVGYFCIRFFLAGMITILVWYIVIIHARTRGMMPYQHDQCYNPSVIISIVTI